MTDREHLAFALAAHRVVAPDPRADACWSPFSVASALGLVAQGARGLSRDELAMVLLGEKDGDLTALGALLTAAGQLEQARTGEDEPVVAVTNTLWTDASIQVRDEFAAELGAWSSGTVRGAPFQQSPERARELINTDVADTTRGLISELLGQDAIHPDTVSALVNALYLKCGWRYRFTKDATTPRPFHTPTGVTDVPTMELTERVGYAATGGWQVVALPAVGGIEAVILLPDGDLATAEPALDTDALAELLAAPKQTRISLRLPKLRVRSRSELTPALHRLGVHTVFSRDADLGGISPDHLAVQAVLHEAVLEIDEQGLEGAAATAVLMRMVSLPTGAPVDVRVDRPFLLLVRHAATGVVHFLTRVVQPGS